MQGHWAIMWYFQYQIYCIVNGKHMKYWYKSTTENTNKMVLYMIIYFNVHSVSATVSSTETAFLPHFYHACRQHIRMQTQTRPVVCRGRGLSRAAAIHALGLKFTRTLCAAIMMTSSNGNIFRVTGHLCGEFPGDRWIPRTKAIDAEL